MACKGEPGEWDVGTGTSVCISVPYVGRENENLFDPEATGVWETTTSMAAVTTADSARDWVSQQIITHEWLPTNERRNGGRERSFVK
jgi:hypothetical protein